MLSRNKEERDMKLIIKRDQDKAFLGGMNLFLECRVELTAEESELIKKYKAHRQPLTYRERKGVEIPGLRIEDLVRGVTYKTKDLDVLLNNEEVIKEACASFKNYLLLMKSFGGEEVIEF
jgi:hypothetical protein